MKIREGFSYVQMIPSKYGSVKGMITFQGRVIIVCEKAVLELKPKKKKP